MISRVRPRYTLAELKAALNPKSGAPGQFETELAHFFGVKHALVFPYGRSAIYATLRGLGLQGEVVQPAYNCVVVAHATVMADCQPVFVDSQPDDPNQNPQAMVDAVTERTVAVIPTSTFGWSFDTKTLSEEIWRRNSNAFVLLDCCQAFDARFDGELLAQAGDAAVLAFGIGKPVTTLFGGALLTSRDDVADQVKQYRDQNYHKRGLRSSLGLWGYFMASWIALSVPFVGLTDWLENNDTLLRRYLYRLRARETIRLPTSNQSLMMAMQAAIGRIQLKDAKSMSHRRQETAARFLAALRNLPGFQEQVWPDGSSFAIFAARLREPERREAFLDALRAEGVQGDTILSYVVPALSCYRALGFRAEDYPLAMAWARSVINLPCYPALTDRQVKRCIKALDRAVHQVLETK